MKKVNVGAMFRTIQDWMAAIWSVFRNSAKSLNSGPGWMPLMMLWAALGVSEILRFGLWVWIAVAVIALVFVGVRSARSLFRLGRAGAFFRPRWWFELSRISIMIATICFSSLISLVLFGQPGPQELAATGILLNVTPISFIGFIVFAIFGYALSYVRRIPLTGKAFECAHYFFCLIVPLIVLSCSIALWQPGAAWRQFVLSMALGIAGALSLLAGFLSIIDGFDKHGKSVPGN